MKKIIHFGLLLKTIFFDSIFRKAIPFLAFLVFLSFGKVNILSAQTTVFSDNFNRSGATALTVAGGAPVDYTILHEPAGAISFTDNGTVLDGASTSTKGCGYVVAPLTTFSSPFSLTLNANPGLVTWTMNMCTATATTNGVFTTTGGNKAMGVILATTQTTAAGNFTGAGNGYAVVNIGRNSSQEWDLVYFTGGLSTITAGNIIASISTGHAKAWQDIKVTYDPAAVSTQWTIYLNDENNASTNSSPPVNDPSTFTYGAGVNGTDATYTGTAMNSFGYAMSYSSTTGNDYKFDNFKCTVVNACSATITADPASPAAVCAGAGTASFTVSATGATTYVWKQSTDGGATFPTTLSNTGVYSGTGTATLTITNPPATMNGYKYRVFINGCVNSDGVATLTVNSPPAITGQPASPAPVCSGAGTADFTVAATGAGLTYQWKESTTGSGGTFNNITNGGVYSGATTATLTLTNAASSMSGYAYQVVVSGTCSPAVTSNGTATLSFTTAPSLTGPSSPAAVCSGGGSASFTVTASGGGTLTYVWKESTDGGATFPTTLSNTGVYSGTGTATLTITNPPVTMNNYKYEVIVSNCSGTQTSGVATLTVLAGPSVTGQPVNTTENPGGSANFSVTATGASGYQWQYSATGTAGTFTNLSNGPGSGTTANFTYSNVTTNTLTVATTTGVTASTSTLYYYQCVVISAACNINSGTANLKVINPDPITTSISPSSATEGSGAFTLTVSGTNFVGGAGYASPSVVYWGATALTTTYVNSTTLTASVTASLVQAGTAGTVSVTVKTPGAVNGTSNAQTFTINAVGAGVICTAASPYTFTINNLLPTGGLNFNSFTAAVNDLNNACGSIRNHPIIFNVKAGQTFTENVPAITVIPASNPANTITFQTDGSVGTHPVIQSGTINSGSTDAIITIQGTNYIIFDGIDLKENAANTTAATESEYGYYLRTNTNNSSATIGAQYNTIKNCVVTLNNTNTNTTYGVYQSGKGGTANIGNTYSNVTVYKSFNGIVLSGNSSAIDNSNTINNCIIGPGSSGTNNIGGSLGNDCYGIGAINQNGVSIHDNAVQNLGLSTANNINGIYVTGSSTGVINIYLNKVHDIKNTGSGSSPVAYGVYLSPAAGSTTNIFSNSISGIYNTASTSSLRTAGIYFDSQGSSGSPATGNIYFNSVWLSGSYANRTTVFYTQGQYTSLNINDNIFKYDGIQTNSSNKAYCIYLNDGSGVLITEDYNIYDMIQFSSPYFTGRNGSDITILTAWKNSTGKDVHSQQFFTQFVSTSDLHLADYPSTSYTGLLSDVSLISPSTDMDGQARTTPTIGADEISVATTPIVVISAPNQPAPANIAKGNTDQLIGQYSLAAYAATTGSNAEPIFNGLTLTVHTVAPAAASTDFSNFKLVLYDASTSSNIGTVASYNSPLSFNASGYATIPFNFTTNYDLTGGDIYYVYVTCDVSASPANGVNINVDFNNAGNFSFVPDIGVTPVTKIAPTVIDSGGRQTICTFYYNTSALDSYNITNNPGQITTDIDNIYAWRPKKTDDLAGMGGPPPNFTDDYQVFNIIRNGATFSNATANWGLSGIFSKAIVGDGVTAVTFTVPSGNNIGDTVDVKAKGTLQLMTSFTSTVTPIPPSHLFLGVLSDSSTVDYASASLQTIHPANYGNLKFSGTGDRQLVAGTTGIKNSFLLQSTGAVTSNVAGSTVNFNGPTAQQFIPGNNHNNLIYKNLAVSNTSAFTTQIGENTLVAENIIVDGTLSVTKNLIVPQLDSINLTSNVTSAAVPAGGLLQVNGGIVSNAFGTIFTTSTSTLQFNAGSIFRLASAAVSDAPLAQIPISKWVGGSICRITGIIGPANAGDYSGLDGNYQAFSNVIVECPDLTGKLLLTNATYGGFSADTLTIRNTGTNPASKTGLVQITRENVQEGVNVIKFIQKGGLVTLAENVSAGGTRSFTVAKDFSVYDSLPSTNPARFEIFDDKNGTARSGILSVGGDFYMDPTARLYKTTLYTPANDDGNTATLIFNGSAGNQNATFGIIASPTDSGKINFEVNKTQVGGGNDTVKLGSNLTSTFNLSLTKGVLSIRSNTLTINGAVTNGTGSIAGSNTSNLTIGSSAFASTAAGTLLFSNNTAGSPNNNYLKNFTLYNSATATIGNALNITAGTGAGTEGSLILNQSSVLSTGGFLTLKSANAGTSRVAPAGGSGATLAQVNGKVTIERYVPGYRAWRLMTAPLRSGDTLSINSAWQESVVDPTLLDNDPVNPNPGFGTHITGGATKNPPFVGNTDNGFGPNGFDAAPAPNNSSIFSYNGTAWATIPQTTHVPLKNEPGYMLFVRGSRSTDLRQQTGAPTTSTILRPKGNIKIGDTTVPISGTGFKVIGNPYASTVNYYNIKHNSSNTGAKFSSYYYAWDPLITGSNNVGAFVTYIEVGDHIYTAIPNPSDHTIDKDGSIQSSQAFVVYDSTSNVVISETDKTSGSDHYAFGRPAGDFAVSQLRTNLYAVNSNGTLSLSDGTLNLFDNSYINGVNLLEDAKKIGQFAENLALQKDSQLLSVEKRKFINSDDTIFYNIKRMKQKHYRLEFIAQDMDQPGLLAFFEDRYTNTRKPVNLEGTTIIDIIVDGNAASSAINRFRIVFKTTGNPLPVSYSSVQAWQQDHDIAVEWKVENEVNISQYEVEKSTDGRNFIKVNITPARGDAASILYEWLDTEPVNGINYYRIRSIDNNGNIKYSPVVQVKIGKQASVISVYPNPVKDGVIHLQLGNMPTGIYQLRLFNTVGQLVQTSTVIHNRGSAPQTLLLDKMTAKGLYQLEITHPDNSKTNIKLETE